MVVVLWVCASLHCYPFTQRNDYDRFFHFLALESQGAIKAFRLIVVDSTGKSPTDKNRFGSVEFREYAN
ncbi:hypothetical protein Kalk_08960 [Ketobacter alkanivorans]|uniref:Uncharacterized protein n=1 Tax=Ketobacter alkanivorans TaxID=1917421 RepID=A0A2K9LJW7_9GAMM|nr:hypothetical protein Kalk_08960 [Ketobacter alkanivorans]